MTLIGQIRAAVGPAGWIYQRTEGGHEHSWTEPGGDRGVIVEPYTRVVEGWVHGRPILMRGVDDQVATQVIAALRGFEVLPRHGAAVVALALPGAVAADPATWLLATGGLAAGVLAMLMMLLVALRCWADRRAHARWARQHTAAQASFLPGYTPQTQDLYLSMVEAPARWSR